MMACGLLPLRLGAAANVCMVLGVAACLLLLLAA